MALQWRFLQIVLLTGVDLKTLDIPYSIFRADSSLYFYSELSRLSLISSASPSKRSVFQTLLWGQKTLFE